MKKETLSESRCVSYTRYDGKRCLNSKKYGNYCGKHYKEFIKETNQRVLKRLQEGFNKTIENMECPICGFSAWCKHCDTRIGKKRFFIDYSVIMKIIDEIFQEEYGKELI